MESSWQSYMNGYTLIVSEGNKVYNFIGLQIWKVQ